MNELIISQMIRDLLEQNAQSNNPVSIITNVNTQFDTNDKLFITLETIDNRVFEVSVVETK